MPNQTKTASRRQEIRAKRRKKEQQQRLFILIGIVGAVLILILVIGIPYYRQANAPVDEFVRITPQSRPSEDGTSLGDPNAKVKVEVFEDFRCSGCMSYSQRIEPLIIQDYVQNGKVVYIFRQYPFLDDKTTSKDSDRAAMGSMCAAEQNRFWDFHDLLYANLTSESAQYSNKKLVAFAKSLELDTTAFSACLEENRFQNLIDEDLALGQERNVNATPTIFVNGQEVKSEVTNQIPSYDQIKAAIEAALGSSGN